MSWILNVLIAIDQLGNAIAGGNPDNTISASAAFYARLPSNKFRKLWSWMEKLINLTFEPVDGKDHCMNALAVEVGHHFEEVNAISVAIFAVLACLGCIILFIPIRLVAIIKKSV